VRPGTSPGAARARGAALIVFLLVLVLVSAAQLLRGLNQSATATGHQTEELARSGAALREAKQALLGAAIAHDAWKPAGEVPPGEGPGHFSCAAPSTDLEADGTCGSGMPVQSAGFFPLSRDEDTRPSLPRILDGSGSPLVFVMDTHFSKEPARPVHLGHTPRLLLDGVPVVALLFAPGAVRANQSRPQNAPFAIEHHLEDPDNIDGDVRYVTPRQVLANDLVLAITHIDLLCAIRPRVRAARVLQEAFNLNPASPPPPAWYGGEGWNDADGAGGTRGAELEALDCG